MTSEVSSKRSKIFLKKLLTARRDPEGLKRGTHSYYPFSKANEDSIDKTYMFSKVKKELVAVMPGLLEVMREDKDGNNLFRLF